MATKPNRIIINASPVVAVLVQPEFTVTMPVMLPPALSQRLKQMHADEAACRAVSFDQWLQEQLATIAYGPGVDPGEALDWLER